ncbi:hypothetical protein [Trueperella pyogenes]|uniref:hypothetical protein n=1 Tax=Trueperella pyogenes TaxID=1661 RepID=UPI00351A15CD
MRIVIATCSVDYSGRLDAHLEPANAFSCSSQTARCSSTPDGGSYKPLNWMSPAVLDACGRTGAS